MPIPNSASLYQKIQKGAEGGKEFARIMDLLLIAEGRDTGKIVRISSDSIGDYKGVDCIIEHRLPYKDFHTYTGVQYKFFPSNLSSAQKHEIKRSLENAIEKFPEMDKWILITPEDFNKNDMQWFDSLAARYQRVYSLEDHSKQFVTGSLLRDFEIFHLGHTEIVEMVLRNPHIGVHYFETPTTITSEQIELAKVSVDTLNTNWSRSSQDMNKFFLRTYYDNIKKSNELIFDFQFINNYSNIFLLHQIDIAILDISSSIKGLPHEIILTSSGNIEYDIDFKKHVNTIQMDSVVGGPIIFQSKSSLRFGLHLIKFVEKCPGNDVRLQFTFSFDKKSIVSEIITLDF